MKHARGGGRGRWFFVLAALAVAALGPVGPAGAEPTPRAFTYQGTLLDGGVPASGAYDLQARLYDAASGGAAVGDLVEVFGVNVAAGQFSVPLNFGPLAFFNSQRLWLELRFQPAGGGGGGGGFTTLAPRQEITPVPYALGVVAPVSLVTEEAVPLNVQTTGLFGTGIISRGSTAIMGISNAPEGDLGIGLRGLAGTFGYVGVLGETAQSGPFARGVAGYARGGSGIGVLGESLYGGDAVGVLASSLDGLGVQAAGRTGVKGDATGGGGDFGGQFSSNGFNSNGVKGECHNGASAYGVWGASSTGFAGYFSGKVQVVGALSKSSGSFKIDHPLDPSGKYLYHSFVESPDMMNIYNGIVTTDARGYARVTLPDWFTALNRDYRYQLTVIDEGDSPDFVLAKIVRGVPVDAPPGVPAAFTLRTSRPGVKVSWQVTGIRQDAWANAHRIRVEEPKVGPEAGRYLHPELFGQPASLRIEALKGEPAPAVTPPPAPTPPRSPLAAPAKP